MNIDFIQEYVKDIEQFKNKIKDLNEENKKLKDKNKEILEDFKKTVEYYDDVEKELKSLKAQKYYYEDKLQEYKDYVQIFAQLDEKHINPQTKEIKQQQKQKLAKPSKDLLTQDNVYNNAVIKKYNKNQNISNLIKSGMIKGNNMNFFKKYGFTNWKDVRNRQTAFKNKLPYIGQVK